ncbi:MAG: hypothetical protein KDA37_09340 [Planctomycetales bacterium]|nr:hypothetical protein [Planctomycetales bacterium]
MSFDLPKQLSRSALAFRGYNSTNLGRSSELLAVPAYAGVMKRRLVEIQEVAADELKRPVNLVARIEQQTPTGFEDYPDAVALVYAVELAQVDLLREVHGLDIGEAQLAFGYSLGELVALAAAGVVPQNEAIRAPIAMAEDCAALAHDVTMGVVFSRRMALNEAEAHRLCAEITAEGAGAIAISAVLSPNTLLVLGQHGTLQRFRDQMSVLCASRVYMRLNDARWPPLHTPIVRQRCIPDRASVMIQSFTSHAENARPPVFSLVTGKMTTDVPSIPELLRDWVDRPQRLWDAVVTCLASGVQCVIHVGPEPNLVPATFQRLAENVQQQKSSGVTGLSIRALRRMANRPWLASLLPQRTALLRAPQVKQVMLEDWLLDNAPKAG